MKKLIYKTVSALLFFSILLVSCKKEGVYDAPSGTEPTADQPVSYEWQRLSGKIEKGSGKGSIEIKNGERADYTFYPMNCCAPGKDFTWTYKAPKLAKSGKFGDKLIVTLKDAGEWVITIIGTCSDGTTHEVEITVTIE